MQMKSHHIALRTPDFARAKAFYTETLGLSVVGNIPGKEVIFIDIGGTTIELVSGPQPEKCERPGMGLMHLAFEVQDVDAAYSELAAKGVQFFITPTSVGDIRLAFFRDPDGNELELFHSPTLTWCK